MNTPDPRLPNRAHEVLAQYRDQRRMPEVLRAAVWARLQEPSDGLAPRRPRTISRTLAVAAIAAAFVLGIGFGSIGGQWVVRTEEADPSLAADPWDRADESHALQRRPIPGAHRSHDPSSSLPLAEHRAEAASITGGTSESTGRTEKPATRVPSSNAQQVPRRKGNPRSEGADGLAPSDKAAERSPSSMLAEERNLLGGAWSAMARDDLAEALRLTQMHEHRFPEGILKPERHALRAMLGCKAGQPSSGQRFLEDYPDSPLTRQVRETCERSRP